MASITFGLNATTAKKQCFEAMNFAQQLLSDRTRLGLTQAEAAGILKTSASWVDKAERNQRAPHILMREGALSRLKNLKPKKP